MAAYRQKTKTVKMPRLTRYDGNSLLLAIMIMIKKITYILSVLFIFCFSLNVAAGQCQLKHGGYIKGEKFHGPTKCQNAIVKNIIVAGTLDLKNTKITGELKSLGLTMTHNSIINKAKVFGYLSAKNTIFEDVLDINSTKARLTSCKTKNILMTSSGKKKAFLFLRNTIVDGNIGFPYENGVVILSKGAKINGRVIGGKVRVK